MDRVRVLLLLLLLLLVLVVGEQEDLLRGSKEATKF